MWRKTELELQEDERIHNVHDSEDDTVVQSTVTGFCLPAESSVPDFVLDDVEFQRLEGHSATDMIKVRKRRHGDVTDPAADRAQNVKMEGKGDDGEVDGTMFICGRAIDILSDEEHK